MTARWTRRKPRLVAAALALGALLGAAGCDWLEGSGSGARVSPFLSALSVAPSRGVLCGEEHPFVLSFRYDDPQQDLFQLTVKLKHTLRPDQRESTSAWDELDLSVAGRATYKGHLPCGSPTGRWSVTVQAEDARGHLSNELTGIVTLNSSV